MNKKNTRKGFTIVELVIVIAVIAILATVLVPTFGNIIDKANNSKALQAARNEYTAYIAEAAEKGNSGDDFIVEAEGKFFAVVNGSMSSTAYASVEAAQAAFDTAANTVATGTAVGKVTPVTVTAKSAS